MRPLVAALQVCDAEPGFPGHLQHLPGGRERVGHLRAVVRRAVLFSVHDDEAAAHGIVGPDKVGSGHGDGREPQSVWMPWQHLAPEGNVGRGIEGGLPPRGEANAPRAAGLPHEPCDLVGIDGVRSFAEQAEHHRDVRGVPPAGQSEGAEQLDPDRGDVHRSWDLAQKAARGHHGADGVGARRADPDAKEVEQSGPGEGFLGHGATLARPRPRGPRHPPLTVADFMGWVAARRTKGRGDPR